MVLTTRRAVRLAAAVFAMTACGSTPDSTVSTDGSAPFHAVPDDAVVVSGTATCEFSDEGTDADGESGGFLIVCELDLSDERVSGTERHDRFEFVTGAIGDGAIWLAHDAAITTTDGTWRGSVQAAENAAAIPSGEAHSVGEGIYGGLTFHSYLFHTDLGAPAEVRGWISDGA